MAGEREMLVRRGRERRSSEEKTLHGQFKAAFVAHHNSFHVVSSLGCSASRLHVYPVSIACDHTPVRALEVTSFRLVSYSSQPLPGELTHVPGQHEPRISKRRSPELPSKVRSPFVLSPTWTRTTFLRDGLRILGIMAVASHRDL